MTRREALFFFLSIATVSLVIAGYFTALGYWPVLPFAGLELALLGYVMMHSMRRGSVREVVSIGKENVRLERGIHKPAMTVELPRHWTQVRLERSPITWYPSKLMICAHNRRYEIGKYLTEAERVSLKRRLSTLIGDERRS